MAQTNDQGNIYESPLDPTLTILADPTSTANVVYYGQAVPGTATSAAAWRIKAVTSSGGAFASVTWAGGGQFNQIWANRTSLTYA